MTFIKVRAFKEDRPGSFLLINLDCVTDIFIETQYEEPSRLYQIVVNLSSGAKLTFTDKFATELYEKLKVNGVIN